MNENDHHVRPKSAKTDDLPSTDEGIVKKFLLDNPALGNFSQKGIPRPPFQFSMRQMLAWVAAFAVTCAAFRAGGFGIGSSVLAMVLLSAYLFWKRAAPVKRHAAAAALGCLMATSTLSFVITIIPAFTQALDNHDFLSSTPEILMITGVVGAMATANLFWLGMAARFSAVEPPVNPRSLIHSMWLGPVALGLMVLSASVFVRVVGRDLSWGIVIPGIMLILFVPPFLIGRFVTSRLHRMSEPSKQPDSPDA